MWQAPTQAQRIRAERAAEKQRKRNMATEQRCVALARALHETKRLFGDRYEVQQIDTLLCVGLCNAAGLMRHQIASVDVERYASQSMALEGLGKILERAARHRMKLLQNAMNETSL